MSSTTGIEQRLVLERERFWAFYAVMALAMLAFAVFYGTWAAALVVGVVKGFANGEAVEPGFWLMGGFFGALLALAFWFIYRQVRVLLWNLFGVEILSTDGVHLRVTRRTLGRETTREFRLEEIENLMVAREEHFSDPHLRQHCFIEGGWLCFTYRGQKVRCGKCLNLFSGAEARDLVLAWKQAAAAGA